MDFQTLLNNKKISSYRLSKDTGIPYTTINDLINSRTNIGNLSLKYAIRIADYLDVDIHSLLELNKVDINEFRYFRNNVLNQLKREGNDQFVNEVIKKRLIDYYHKHNQEEYALYLLALIDYLCRIEKKDIYKQRYNSIRKEKLDKPFFVGSNLITFNTIEEAEKELHIEVIPEFKKYNIIEENIRNVA